MAAGLLGCITTPVQGNAIPPCAYYAADNGKFGAGWPGAPAWWSWVEATVRKNGPWRCAFVTAPDVVCDPVATLAESVPWLPRIRQLGVPAAFVAQDGCEHGLVPWGQFDVLFIGGSTEWKIGPAVVELVTEAKAHGATVHMGRVNSRRRLRRAHAFGCDSADGTYLVFGPRTNLPRLLSWLAELEREPTLWA